MSYDITLVRPRAGEDPAAAYQRYVRMSEDDGGEISAATRAGMQRLADLLKARVPGFTQFEPEKLLPWIELNEEELLVQITIGEHSVDITMPYFRENASGMLACARTCVEVLSEAEGYLAYDPQLERFVTPADFEAMDAQYHAVDAYFPEVIASRDRNKKQPWWKFW